MLTDAFTRLSGTVGLTPAPQDIDDAAAATPLLSTNWIDLVDPTYPDNGNTGDGGELFARFLIATENVTSGTATATVEFQLIATPRTTAAGVVFTADASTDTITSVAHGFLEGTTLILTNGGGALPAGLAVTTHYFVRNPTADTFQVSLTPGGAIVDITGAGTGTHTATHQPTIVASSGPVPKNRCFIGNTVTVRSNPLWQSPAMPKHRYLFARYVVSADLTAGMAYCDVSMGPADQRFIHHRSGFVAQ